MRKIVAKIFKWLSYGLMFVLVFVFGVYAYNAFDDELSSEARALMAATPLNAPDESNSYVWLVGLNPTGEPAYPRGKRLIRAYQERNAMPQAGVAETNLQPIEPNPSWPPILTKSCMNEKMSCLDRVDGSDYLLTHHAAALAQYKLLRALERFDEIYIPIDLTRSLIFTPTLAAQGLARLEMSEWAHTGNIDLVIDSLEAEFGFHRRISASAGNFISKLYAVAALRNDAGYLSELIATGMLDDRKYDTRIVRMLQPLSTAELSFDKPTRQTAASSLRATALVRSAASGLPWYSRWLQKPQGTMNLEAAQWLNVLEDLHNRLAHPSEIQLNEAPTNKGLPLTLSSLDNPRGKFVVSEEMPDWHDHVNRALDVQVIMAGVQLQYRLRQMSRGQDAHQPLSPQQVAVASAGIVNAYTAKPFLVDTATRSMVFEVRELGSTLHSADPKRAVLSY